jgi:hypothetical protein
MSRCDQWMGLSDWACEFLVQNPPVAVEEIGSVEGAWSPVAGRLRRFTFPDGQVLEEFVQATPWESGPMYLIALRDPATGHALRRSLWRYEDWFAGPWRTFDPRAEIEETMAKLQRNRIRAASAAKRGDTVAEVVYGRYAENVAYCLETLKELYPADCAALGADKLLAEAC